MYSGCSHGLSGRSGHCSLLVLLVWLRRYGAILVILVHDLHRHRKPSVYLSEVLSFVLSVPSYNILGLLDPALAQRCTDVRQAGERSLVLLGRRLILLPHPKKHV